MYVCIVVNKLNEEGRKERDMISNETLGRGELVKLSPFLSFPFLLLLFLDLCSANYYHHIHIYYLLSSSNFNFNFNFKQHTTKNGHQFFALIGLPLRLINNHGSPTLLGLTLLSFFR